jgi:O-methyltransferase
MDFPELYNVIRDLTLVSHDRCEWLYKMSRHAAQLPGDIAEVGVYRGGTSLLLAMANPCRTVHAFDTFAGIPNADDAVDGHRNGDFGDAPPETPMVLESRGIRVHRGVFPATAENVADRRFCFAHFDGDTYRSAADFLAFFWPRLSVGGVLVFDDFNWHMCRGVNLAIERFASAGPIPTTGMQAMLIKATSTSAGNAD